MKNKIALLLFAGISLLFLSGLVSADSYWDDGRYSNRYYGGDYYGSYDSYDSGYRYGNYDVYTQNTYSSSGRLGWRGDESSTSYTRIKTSGFLEDGTYQDSLVYMRVNRQSPSYGYNYGYYDYPWYRRYYEYGSYPRYNYVYGW